MKAFSNLKKLGVSAAATTVLVLGMSGVAAQAQGYPPSSSSSTSSTSTSSTSSTTSSTSSTTSTSLDIAGPVPVSISLNASTYFPSTTAVLTVTACTAGETVTISVAGGSTQSKTCGSANTRTTGNTSFTFTTPAKVGVYTVTVTFSSTGSTLSTRFEVVDANSLTPTTAANTSTSVRPTSLPATGASGIGRTLSMGGIVLVGGLSLLMVARRRKLA